MVGYTTDKWLSVGLGLYLECIAIASLPRPIAIIPYERLLYGKTGIKNKNFNRLIEVLHLTVKKYISRPSIFN